MCANPLVCKIHDGKVYVVNVLMGKVLHVQRVGVQSTKDRYLFLLNPVRHVKIFIARWLVLDSDNCR